MGATMKSQELLTNLVSQSLQMVGSDEHWLLATMIVLHTQDLLLDESVFLDDVNWGDSEHRLNAITRRHATEVIADAIGKNGDVAFMDTLHARYLTKSPFELMESVSDEFKPAVERIRSEFESDVRVKQLAEPE